MKIKDSGLTVGRADGWVAAPTEAITTAIRSLPNNNLLGYLTASAARWLCAALAEETDDLRRFIFSYAGLETLVAKVEKDSRAELISRIVQADPTLPVRDLLWPSSNEDLAVRNLVFRFASMATVYSPNTSIEDVTAFRSMAKLRNDLYHGSDDAIDRSASVQCQELLRRYLSLVASTEGIEGLAGQHTTGDLGAKP